MGRIPAWTTAPISIAILPYTTSLDVRKPSLAIARYSVASIKSASFRGSTVPATMSFAAFTEPRITPLAPMKTVPAAATISPSKVPLMVIDSGPLISMTPLKVMLGAKTVPSLGAVRREERLSMTDPVKLICAPPLDLNGLSVRQFTFLEKQHGYPGINRRRQGPPFLEHQWQGRHADLQREGRRFWPLGPT